FGHTLPSHAFRTQPSTPPPPPFHAKAFASPPLPLHARPSRGGDPWLFDAILTSSASLACQSEPEVVSRGSNTPCSLRLPRMPDRAGGAFMVFPRCSRLFHLPCM